MRLPGRAPRPDTTFRELFRTGIFTLLEEGGRHSISGVAGRLWTPSGHYARFETGADYKEYAEPGTAKVALLTSVREHERGSEIVSETRVWCADRRAQLRFRPYWALVGPFSRFIRIELLSAVTKRADRARSRSPRAMAGRVRDQPGWKAPRWPTPSTPIRAGRTGAS